MFLWIEVLKVGFPLFDAFVANMLSGFLEVEVLPNGKRHFGRCAFNWPGHIA